MSEIENIFNADILTTNINAAAYFILLYEHFEDVVINTVQEFYSNPCIMDGVLYTSIDDDYIRVLEKKIKQHENNSLRLYELLLSSAKVQRQRYVNEVLKPKKELDNIRDGIRFHGSLNWLQGKGVILESESNRILKIRKRRNTIVHELFQLLGEGLTEDDAKMIADLLNYNNKVNNWRFQQIDMPVLGLELPEGVAAENVISGDDVALMGMFRILFCNEGEVFKEALERAKASQPPLSDDHGLKG